MKGGRLLRLGVVVTFVVVALVAFGLLLAVGQAGIFHALLVFGADLGALFLVELAILVGVVLLGDLLLERLLFSGQFRLFRLVTFLRGVAFGMDGQGQY